MPPAAKHRESLLAASAALFQRQGYAGTGLAEILTVSGAPKGSLYHYFPDGKEAIAEQAIRLAGVSTGNRIRAAAARAPHPRDFVALYAAALSKMLSESGYSRGCPVATVALEAAPQSERLTAACRDAITSWCDGIADMLVAAGIETPRAAALADIMMCTFQGALVLARIRQSTAPLDVAAAEITRVFERELESNEQ